MAVTPRFEIRRGRWPRRHHYFVLIAENGEIIATSEHYNSLTAAETGIASVKRNARAAKVTEA